MTKERKTEGKSEQGENRRVSRRDLVSMLGIGTGGAVAAAAIGGCIEQQPVGTTEQSLTNQLLDVVETLSDLRALIPSGGSPEAYRVLGYYQPGDGGGGVFFWDTETVAQSIYGSHPDEDLGTVITPTDYAGDHRWIRVHEGVFNVKHFGAHDDSSDPAGETTAAIKAAFAAAEAAPNVNHVVYFPTGAYLYDGSTAIQLYEGTQAIGEGSNSSRIIFSGPVCEFLRYQDDGKKGWSVRHLGFRTTVPCTLGEVIHCVNKSSGSQDAVIEDITFGAQIGVRFHNLIRLGPRIQQVTIRDVVAGGGFNIAVFVHNSHNIVLSDFLLNGAGDPEMGLSGGTGIYLKAEDDGEEDPGIEAFVCERGIVANCDRALHIAGQKVPGQPAARLQGVVSNSKFVSTYFDDAQTHDSALIDTATNLTFTDCYFVSAARNGARVINSNHIYFDGCQFDKNSNHGLAVLGPDLNGNTSENIYVTGGSAKDNADTGELNMWDGISMASGVEGFVINGVDCKSDTSVYGNPQRYGIAIGTNCDNFIVVNNDLRGAGISNAAGTDPTRKIVAHNMG